MQNIDSIEMRECEWLYINKKIKPFPLCTYLQSIAPLKQRIYLISGDITGVWRESFQLENIVSFSNIIIHIVNLYYI